MGTGEEGTPAKPSKPISSSQETPTTPYPEWTSPMQAYYGAGVTPFFPSTIASPTPHSPYLWGSQHPLIPPYGTPVPYPALYPSGGVYAHPNMTLTSAPVQPNVETEGKAFDRKDQFSRKKSKGTSKAAESSKATSGSGNDGATQSAESGSEDSSNASDENANHHELAAIQRGRFSQMLVEATTQNHTAEANLQVSVPVKPASSMPLANLNMDLWNASPTGSGAVKLPPNASGISPAVAPAAGMMPDHHWVRDERELKRQKRKQSNRESARRSRLRKQAECEELQQRVETMSNENRSIRDELQRLSEQCKNLTSENSSIKEELARLCGQEAVSDVENNTTTTTSLHLQSGGDESNS